MGFHPSPVRHAKLFAVILFITLAAGGCGGKAMTQRRCTNITVTVDHTKPRGVDRKARYLCSNNTITWMRGPNVKSFDVEFVGPDLPFGNNTTFSASGSTNSVTTPPLPDPGEYTVFKYNLKIVENNGAIHTFDPHVVGGGGLID